MQSTAEAGGLASPVAQSSWKYWKVYEAALLVLCAALVIFQLFVPPILGVADNNDFPKLMGRFCLGKENHNLFEYATFFFQYDQKYCWNSELPSSAVLPLRIAVEIAKVISPAGQFDLRILGALYAGMFLFTFWLLQVSVRELQPRARLLVPAVVLLIFDTATYIPSFSTFYFDTASFIFLLLSAILICRMALRPFVSTREYLTTAAVVLLFTTSKTQHTILGLLLIPAFLLPFGRLQFPSKPFRIGAAASIVIASILMFAATPRWYLATNYYNALFFQYLPRSSNPAADLAQLGIDPGMIRYVGQHAFLPDSPMQTQSGINAFSKQVSTGKMVQYYVTHARTSAQVLNHALDEAGLQRVRMEIGTREYRLGNYEQSSGRAPEAQSRFLDFWTALKTAIFGNRGALYGLYAFALLGGAWICALRSAASLRAPAMTIAAMLSAMVIAAAAIAMVDAVETGRHLFLFNALLDVTVCGLVAFSSSSFSQES